MLGSRFDLSEALNEIASRSTETVSEASCLELEREIAAVAQTVHGVSTRLVFRCPVCDEGMQVSDECDLSEFGGLDVKLHKLECEACGMLTGRVYHPSIGYDSHLVR